MLTFIMQLCKLVQGLDPAKQETNTLPSLSTAMSSNTILLEPSKHSFGESISRFMSFSTSPVLTSRSCIDSEWLPPMSQAVVSDTGAMLCISVWPQLKEYCNLVVASTGLTGLSAAGSLRPCPVICGPSRVLPVFPAVLCWPASDKVDSSVDDSIFLFFALVLLRF
jgi:hypothetical protein